MLGCDALWALLWVIWGCGVAFSALTLTLGCLGGGVSPSGLRRSPGGGWGVVCWGRGGVAAGGGVVIRSVPDKSALLLHLLG